MQVCEKNSTNKKREAFDVQAQRITGTEAEQFKDIIQSQEPQGLVKKKGDWKEQHERMIEEVRMAKRTTDQGSKDVIVDVKA